MLTDFCCFCQAGMIFREFVCFLENHWWSSQWPYSLHSQVSRVISVSVCRLLQGCLFLDLTTMLHFVNILMAMDPVAIWCHHPPFVGPPQSLQWLALIYQLTWREGDLGRGKHAQVDLSPIYLPFNLSFSLSFSPLDTAIVPCSMFYSLHMPKYFLKTKEESQYFKQRNQEGFFLTMQLSHIGLELNSTAMNNSRSLAKCK